HLADLPADGDRHALGLEPTDERGELGGERVVRLLLFEKGGLREVDEGRGVDVDVVETGGDRLADEVTDGPDFGLGIDRVFLRVDLEVITLDEERTRPPFLECRGG